MAAIELQLDEQTLERARRAAELRRCTLEELVQDLLRMADEMAAAPNREDDAARQFHGLASEWKKDTALVSSVTQIALHPAYQRIIGMGSAVVPLLLRELEREPEHWFWALRAITGADPVQPADRGKMKEMAAAWVEWGREHGYR